LSDQKLFSVILTHSEVPFRPVRPFHPRGGSKVYRHHAVNIWAKGRGVSLSYILLFFFLLTGPIAFAQFTTEQTASLKAYEDTIRNLSETVIRADSESIRTKACYALIPKLVAALKTPGSFKYPFSSVETMSILYPQDSSFRIFNWMLSRDDGSYRYYAAIQKNNLEKLELIPLLDRSDSLLSPLDTILTAKSWLGALYYNIYEVKIDDKPYYMLFGWEGNDLLSTKKLIDVMYFDDSGKPKFGASIFDMGNGTRHKRFILEYKKEASASLNYSPEQNMIVFDHLAGESGKATDLGFALVPEGSYDGFKWKGDHWEFVEDVIKGTDDSKKNTPVPLPQGSHNMMDPTKKP